jgi:hypothetical protein
LEYYEGCGEQLDHYVSLVKSKNYNYSQHYLPHDGGHGNIRGESVSVQLAKMGLKNTVLDREADINVGIETLRQTLSYSVFDKDKCADGIKSLEAYSYKWNDEKMIFSPSPLHDWSSNAADAARYAAIAASLRKGGLIKKSDPYKNSNVYKNPYAKAYGAGWMAS